MWLSKCTRAYKKHNSVNCFNNISFTYSFRKHQSVICVNFTELREMVCKLFKLSTNLLTVPRIEVNVYRTETETRY